MNSEYLWPIELHGLTGFSVRPRQVEWLKAAGIPHRVDGGRVNQIRAMYLRDMRKRAADLADDIDEASKLLQHSSKTVTATHYRTRPNELKAVR